MNPTLRLLQAIGSPFSCPNDELPIGRELLELFGHAEKNKISLLFLEMCRRHGDLVELAPAYERKLSRYAKINHLMSDVSQLLLDADIEHAIFKTIRPYIAETSDIDILILGDDGQYLRALKQLNEGYRVLGSGPESTTFYDPLADIGIDIYRNVAVSHLVYLSKEKIAESVVEKKLSPGQSVRTLTREGDLITIIAHSLIKEQMLTLAEYYSFLFHLSVMDRVDRLTRLFNDTRTTVAARSFLTLIAALHHASHGEVPKKLGELLEVFALNALEMRKVRGSNLELPHKYGVLTVAQAIRERLGDQTTRRSLAKQLWAMSNPFSVKTIITGVLDHRFRETY